MKRNSGSKRPGFKLVLIVLLAVLCIGAAELAACSHFAPGFCGCPYYNRNQTVFNGKIHIVSQC